jgi:hypothetical protein
VWPEGVREVATVWKEPRGLTLGVYPTEAAAQAALALWRAKPDEYWRNHGLPVRHDWTFEVGYWPWAGPTTRWCVKALPPEGGATEGA